MARELRERLGFDTAAGLKFHARGVGGDLDVVALSTAESICRAVRTRVPSLP